MNKETNQKTDYIILDEFKGGYAIALKPFIIKESNIKVNYVGIIDENLNEVVSFRRRNEGYDTSCSNLRIELGEWVQDEEEYYYEEEIYRYITDGVYLCVKNYKIINFNNRELSFPRGIEVVDFDKDLNLLVLKSDRGYGLGDINCNIIVNPVYARYFSKFHDYIEIEKVVDGISQCGLVDFDGNIIVKPQFEEFVDLIKVDNKTVVIAISTENIAFSAEKKALNTKYFRRAIWEDNPVTEKIAALSTIIIEDKYCKSINYLPVRCCYNELKRNYSLECLNAYVLDNYISLNNKCICDTAKTCVGLHGVSDIYGNTIIPYTYANNILPVKINNEYYFVWGITSFFKSPMLGLLNTNNEEVLKCGFSRLYELNGELYGEKDGIPYKIHLDTLTLENISELPKIQSSNTDNKSVGNNKYDVTPELIYLGDTSIKIEKSDYAICFSSGKKKINYKTKNYDLKINKFSVANEEYLAFQKIDDVNLGGNFIILNKNLNEVININITGNDAYLNTNIANTNCFEIVDCFISPDEDIMSSSRIIHIYDENFNFIDKFNSYKRVNVHEVLSNDKILNLATKETRKHSPVVVAEGDNITDCKYMPAYDDFEEADLPF